MDANKIITGDAIEQLQELPESSVHMCMTSPPYWNLRDYGHDDQLGREETAGGYVDNIADVLDEVRRVLRPDGSLWLNLGDTYDDKDLQQIPARVALELQDRGWVLRNRATWVKPNPMPQSVSDRLNGTTEAVFHLTPSKRYWYDLDAIREEHVDPKPSGNTRGEWEQTGGQQESRMECHPAGKNPGDVFEVTTKPFPEAHFAVYPPELCEKPIKATAPPKVCAECGTGYERVVEEEKMEMPESGKFWDPSSGQYRRAETVRKNNQERSEGIGSASNPTSDVKETLTVGRDTVGWEKTCNCDTDATEAGIVLDPFAGAGTTLLKAKELGRRFIGVELNAEYADMARERVGMPLKDPSRARDHEDQSGIGDW